jgi:hypothetical protein
VSSIQDQAANQYKDNLNLNDPFVQQFNQNPGGTLPAILQRQGNGSMTDPFTRFLLNDLGQQNVLNTLYEFYAPANQNSGPNSMFDFANQLIRSFFPSNVPGEGGKKQAQAQSPFGANLGDYQAVGKGIRSFLTGQGNTLASQTLSKLDPDGVVQALNNFIEASAPFTMNSLQKGLIENQLSDLETKYWASGAYSDGTSFGTYLLQNAALWLNKWWQTGSVEQADLDLATGAAQGMVTPEDSANAAANKAAFNAATGVSGAPTIGVGGVTPHNPNVPR